MPQSLGRSFMMAAKEIRISLEGIDDAKRGKEMLIEFYVRKQLKSATYLTSSKGNEVYDQVAVKDDVDGDGDFDSRDRKLLLALAKAAVDMLK
jgi:hypothetical protein